MNSATIYKRMQINTMHFMLHFPQETAQARETRQKKETARRDFNKRVIQANFVPEALSQRDKERLRRSFARKIIAMYRLTAKPGDFELIGWINNAIAWWDQGNIGCKISIADTCEDPLDVAELSCTVIQKISEVFSPMIMGRPTLI